MITKLNILTMSSTRQLGQFLGPLTKPDKPEHLTLALKIYKHQAAVYQQTMDQFYTILRTMPITRLGHRKVLLKGVLVY